MIVATAGHVDHGKTLLVKALTGVDTDRLPEEKKRSLTIDLGFAYIPANEARREPIGFIDVPGHERFVKNALCGLAGTDFVLFVIAADDGPMPQTREHLAIVDLLGISRGAIALTKIDRVPAARREAVSAEIQTLFSGTTLASAPLYAVSALTGDGIPELLSDLEKVARTVPPRSTNGNFRLAIDRRFPVTGSGLVVTGTAFSGRVGTGDTLRLLGANRALRVRAIHAQNTESAEGVAGQRCALNVTGPGVTRDAVERGDWMVGDGVPDAVGKLDAELTVLADEARPLSHWTPVHVHLGAAETPGRVAVLEGPSVPPGGTGLVQLVLDHPIGAVHADRFIIRDQSARRTIGGGRVLDIFPPARGRARPERLRWLSAMREPDHAQALAKLTALSPTGLDVEKFRANRNLTSQEISQFLQTFDGCIVTAPSGPRTFSAADWAAIRDGAKQRLAAWHAAHPGDDGLPPQRLFEPAMPRITAELATALADALVAEGILARAGRGVRLPSHAVQLAGPDQELWDLVERALAAMAPRPMTLNEIAEATRLTARRLEPFLGRAGRQNLVSRISKNRFASRPVVLELATRAETLARGKPDGMFSAADFRDASGIGRNVAIEVLEFFDQQRFTHRAGDRRKVVGNAEEMFGNPGV